MRLRNGVTASLMARHLPPDLTASRHVESVRHVVLHRKCPLLTQSGHRLASHPTPFGVLV
jgi:hypothetical protein